MSEQVIVPIVIDPKAGVGGLKQFGDEAVKTGTKVNGAVGAGGKFAGSMKDILKSSVAMTGAMGLATAGVGLLTGALIDFIRNSNKAVTAEKLIIKAREEAKASTMDEVIALQTLFAVAQNETFSKQQRQNAIDQLNKKYPAYLKNLSLENIGTLAVAAAMDKLVSSMITKVQIENMVKEMAKLRNEADQMFKEIDFKAIERKDIIGTLNLFKYNEWTKKLQQFQVMFKETMKLSAENFDVAPKPIDVKTPKVNIKPDKVVISPVGNADVSGFDFSAAMMGAIKIPKTKKKFSATDGSVADNSGMYDDYDAMIKAAEELEAIQYRTADFISGALTPAWDNMFENILNKENAVKSFFQGIMDSVKALIKQLMAAAIQAGVLSLITGGAKGGGLSFVSAFKKVLGFADGGLVTGPVSALVGEGRGTNASNPEVVAPLDKLKVFFADMIGQRNVNAASIGMAGSIVSMPREVTLRMSGREMVGVITLEQMSQTRTG